MLQSTIFVLGAGASMPYGFPSGAKLTEDIKNALGRGGTLKEELLALQYPEGEILTLRHALVKSPFSSIDALLQEREELKWGWPS